MIRADDSVWFEFVESKASSKQVRELSGDVLANTQSDLVQNPERGALVKGRTAFEKVASLIPTRRAVRAGVIDIFTFTLNTLVGFTCYTSSAKEIKLICHRSKS